MSRFRAQALALMWLLAVAGGFPTHAEAPVPKDLDGWQSWVLDGQEYLRCPFLAGTDGKTEAQHICSWPGPLSLDLGRTGGRFSQTWVSQNEVWIPIPGNAEFWPRNVSVNGTAAAVVEHRGIPQIRVGAGSFTISGSFLWPKRPESMPIPSQSGLVTLMLDGQKIAHVDRPDGAVWLGKRREAEAGQQLEVQVYRLLSDDVPMMLETRLSIKVAGGAREELLSTVLPPDFRPTALASALPARLEPDGQLRVQVRPGAWDVTLSARAVGNVDKIRISRSTGQWPKQEIWSFAADDRLRVAAVEGAEGIDPSQANVPSEWRVYPSYRVLPGSSLSVIERSRGASRGEGNHLSLQRHLYLDFAHRGFTFIDQISGSMRSDWRLDMRAPFKLLSASSGVDNLLVTEGRDPDLTGVELRGPRIAVASLGRLDVRSGSIPASGWIERFDHVSGVLHLPPGHRLLAAIGADEAAGAWLERWGLLDLFLLLITSVVTWRTLGRVTAIIAFCAVVLVHQEDRSLVWLILFTLLSIIGCRLATAAWPRTALTWTRNILFAASIWVMVPFAIIQVRFALYPQLADPGGYESGALDNRNIRRRIATNSTELPAVIAQLDATATVAPGLQYAPSPKLDAVALTASRNTSSFTFSSARYGPGTLVQAGSGRPDWQFVSYDYGWSGPVDASQSVHFLIMRPWQTGIWRILGVVLLGWLLWRLIYSSIDVRAEWRRLSTKSGTAAAKLVFVCVLATHGTPSGAATTPDPNLLNELKARLTRPLKCLPDCAEIMWANLTLKPTALEATLGVAALSPVAVALPSAANRFDPLTVTIDGKAAAGVYRDADQQDWIALQPGVHAVKLSGFLPAVDSIQFQFPQVPRTITIDGEGWDVAGGVSAGRLLGNTVDLVRRRTAPGDGEVLQKAMEFAPFVRVHRNVNLDLDWSLQTKVERLAPAKGGFSVNVAKLPGESVLTGGIDIQGDQGVLVSFDSSASEFEWQSGLPITDKMTLSAPNDGASVEVWSFTVSPMWHVVFEGIPAVLPERPDSGIWAFEYFPRPGETLTLAVTRPIPSKGGTLAIDAVASESHVGKRTTDGSLRFTYRSTQGGRHSLALPASALVTGVSVDDVAVPVRPEKGELALALLPGQHRVQVKWQSSDGVGLITSAPIVDLHVASSNVTVGIAMPENRWVLFAGGSGIGPAILYWGELIVFLVLAIALGRTRGFPLKAYEWFLLGLGLSTFSWTVLLLFVVWMFALRWRARFAVSELAEDTFRAMQVGLVGTSIVVIVALVAAIPFGLLATPDMRVAGAGESATAFRWFNDQAPGALPTPWVLSLSLWWYKLAMLLWALWLALALVNWLPVAWRALNAGGLWHYSPPTQKSSETTA